MHVVAVVWIKRSCCPFLVGLKALILTIMWCFGNVKNKIKSIVTQARNDCVYSSLSRWHFRRYLVSSPKLRHVRFHGEQWQLNKGVLYREPVARWVHVHLENSFSLLNRIKYLFGFLFNWKLYLSTFLTIVMP